MRYWKRLGLAPSDQPDERTLRVFEVGHVFHNWLQDLLEDQGALAGREIRVEDLHRIGHIDALVLTGKGPLVLYDFKTVNSRKFSYLSAEGDRHYHFQAATYALMLPLGVGEIRLAYISKDDLRIREVPVDLEALRDSVNEDWAILIEAWRAGQEPEANPMDWECPYCGYGSTCPQRHNGEKPKSRKTKKENAVQQAA
jgi:CRISPR/Cas system-associated exonuclease Cas4 (RecB family)